MLYVRFPLSLRNVEDLLRERGIDVSHETIRFWWDRFGPMFASAIRRKRVQVSVRSSVFNHFNQERSLSSRDLFKRTRTALAEWRGLGAA